MRRKRDVRDRDLCKDQCSPPGNNKAMGACKCAWGHERERGREMEGWREGALAAGKAK